MDEHPRIKRAARPDDELLVCHLCGAAVWPMYSEHHIRWHVRQEDGDFTLVHGQEGMA